MTRETCRNRRRIQRQKADTAPGAALHVAAEGHDDNPGTKERPFATLERARDEIRCALGDQASGAYNLRVTIPAQKPREFSALPCDPKFRALEWFGFTSLANEPAVFGLDDLSLRP